jgi:hypothetical protein
MHFWRARSSGLHAGVAMSFDWSRLDQYREAMPSLWQSVGIAVGLVVLIWLTLRLKAWFREDAAGADNAMDLLTDMKEIHQQGGLTEEEFRLIKSRLVQTAAGNGVSSKVRTTPRPAAETTAKTAADATPAESLHGRSDDGVSG